MEKDDAFYVLKQATANSKWDNETLKLAIKTIKNEAEDGLSCDEIEFVADALCSNKFGPANVSELILCLVPESCIADKVLKQILSWIFTNVKQKPMNDRRCFGWILGTVRHEMCSKEILYPYFYSFFVAMLECDHLEPTICSIIYLIIRREDIKRFHVRLIQEKLKKKISIYLRALLTRMKKYRPDLVREDISPVDLPKKKSALDEILTKIAERRQRIADNDAHEISLKWGTFQPRAAKEKRLQRLIPPIEHLPRKSLAIKKPAIDFRTLKSLGRQLSQFREAAQTISLLSNEGGFHVLAFSDQISQAIFTFNLGEILETVFLMGNEQYSCKEKEVLLQSILGLQNYIQQGLEVVNKFLCQYLSMWDGSEFAYSIFGLMEWFTFNSIEDWNLVNLSLQSLFHSGSIDFKCRLIETLSALIRNSLLCSIRTSRDIQPLFLPGHDPNPTTIVASFGKLVKEILQDGLSCYKIVDKRRIMSVALDYYETALDVEESGDLPIMSFPPSCVVYFSILSSSVHCIERICELLRRYASTNERLHRHGVYTDYEVNFDLHLSNYYVDVYRALFSGIGTVPQFRRGLLNAGGVIDSQGLEDKNALTLKRNPIWRSVDMTTATIDPGSTGTFPSVESLKILIEGLIRNVTGGGGSH